MDARVYEFLLDYFPLIDVIMQENAVLGRELQRAGMDVLYDAMSDTPSLRRIEWLRLLMRLAYDLGYIDEDVERYLARSLREIAESIS